MMNNRLDEEFYAVFDETSITRYSSLVLAQNANSLHIVNSYRIDTNKNSGGQNWYQVIDIYDNQGQLSGLTKGRWKTNSKWVSGSSYFSLPINYELIDPKGKSEQLQTRATSANIKDVILEIMKVMKQTFHYQDWTSYQLKQENNMLKALNLKLTEENKKLKAQITAFDA